MRRLAHLVPLVLVPGRFATTVTTQEATSPIEFVSPDPSECQITPRTLAPVLALEGHGQQLHMQSLPLDDTAVRGGTSGRSFLPYRT